MNIIENSNILQDFLCIPAKAVLIMRLPIEWPTKLSLISFKLPLREALSIFFLRKAITSLASRTPISLKSPEVLSSFAADIKNCISGSIKSHWFRTSRKSKWFPCYIWVIYETKGREITKDEEIKTKTDHEDKSNYKNVKPAWNPWTKTTALKTCSFCWLLPHNLFVVLNPFPRTCLASSSIEMMFERTLPERYTFVMRSTIIIGTSKGSPNICMSWRDRLLICMELICCKFQPAETGRF